MILLHYGVEHPETAIAFRYKYYLDLNKYEIAKDLLTKALKIDELHNGYEHP
jgi:hypothetical protein